MQKKTSFHPAVVCEAFTAGQTTYDGILCPAGPAQAARILCPPTQASQGTFCSALGKSEHVGLNTTSSKRPPAQIIRKPAAGQLVTYARECYAGRGSQSRSLRVYEWEPFAWAAQAAHAPGASLMVLTYLARVSFVVWKGRRGTALFR